MVQVVEKVLRGFSRAMGIETPEDLDIKYENSKPLVPQESLWEHDPPTAHPKGQASAATG